MSCSAGATELDLHTVCANGGSPVVNNLAGIGPDTGVAEEIRYPSVGVHSGRPIDM